MFNCGTPSQCVFAEHESYIAMLIKDEADGDISSGPHLSNHESDLQGLGTTHAPLAPKPPITTPQMTPGILMFLYKKKIADNF